MNITVVCGSYTSSTCAPLKKLGRCIKKISSIDDPRLLKVGVALIAFGFLIFILSLVYNFASIIALRPAGVGVFICLLYAWGRFKKRPK